MKNNFLLLCAGMFTFSFVLFSGFAFAQEKEKTKIELLGANDLRFSKEQGVDAQRLIGNVKFRHQGAIMHCDSAWLYEKQNSIDAFGNVHINQGDTIHLYGDLLYYDGNTRIAQVRENIRLLDADMTLTTDYLDYDRNSNTGIFNEGGEIVSSENNNILNSIEGFYFAEDKTFIFRDSTRLNNPEYRIETDTLKYQTVSEIAYFYGPTYIFSDENTIYCENGWYNTSTDISQFNKNAYLISGANTISGDSLYYSRNEGIGKAYENVSINDTVNNFIIDGNYAEYLELEGKSFVTGEARFIQMDMQDSLFLHGDTLRVLEDSILGNQIFAYYNVRFFRKDLQGVSDSLVYKQQDSLIHFYRNPMLWSEQLQIVGDSISLKTYDGIVEKLFVRENSMMISKVDSSYYDQIKGKNITGYFRNNDLYKLMVDGNGESLYYAMEEQEGDAPPKIIGVNKAICSNIAIYMEDNEVQKITFLKQPEGTFFPLSKFPEEDKLFNGFVWDEERRPKNKDDIFRKAEPKERLEKKL